jgi:hypothetical protein
VLGYEDAEDVAADDGEETEVEQRSAEAEQPALEQLGECAVQVSGRWR